MPIDMPATIYCQFFLAFSSNNTSNINIGASKLQSNPLREASIFHGQIIISKVYRSAVFLFHRRFLPYEIKTLREDRAAAEWKVSPVRSTRRLLLCLCGSHLPGRGQGIALPCPYIISLR